MQLVNDDSKNVRASNEGHAFHVVWTTRRCLRLLNPFSNLKAVVVEGISPKDKAISKEGILKADTAEYYGDENFEKADKFVLAQLKHSSFNEDQPWTASGVEDTFRAFAKDFKKKCRLYGEKSVKTKAKYLFVTNRPISDSLSR